MEESVTYQAILEKGESRGEARGQCAEARRIIRRLGEEAFGPITPEFEAALKAETDLNRLEQIADRLRSAASWDELMGKA